MREIDVHDFHRRVILNGEPVFAGLRAAAVAVTGDASASLVRRLAELAKAVRRQVGVSFTDWGVWNKTR